MLETFQDETSGPTKRTIKIFPNGGRSLKHTLLNLPQDANFSTIKTALQGNAMQVTKLRLFTMEGVELFNEDVTYLRHQANIYASFDGEDFDASASFQQFEMLQLIGQGGFGRVLLAQNKLNKQRVAIKIVNTVSIGNAEDIDMVFREAEMLKQLSHKGIVKIFNCFTLNNMNVVFVMEYLEGGELLQYIQGDQFIRIPDRGNITESEARIFFNQMVDAVAYCHSQKLIHRDLKLENIMLAAPNSRLVKVVDFGIAGMATNLNVQKIDAGSLKYMAPELFTQRLKKLGPHIDVWALGVILFGMVFGSLPFDGATPEETLDNICEGRPNYPRECSVELRDLLSRIFMVDHHKRISMSEIMAHPWCLEQAIYGAVPETPLKSVTRIRRDPSKPIVRDSSRLGNNPKSQDFTAEAQRQSLVRRPELLSPHPLLRVPKEFQEFLPQIHDILRSEGKLPDLAEQKLSSKISAFASIQQSNISEQDSPMSLMDDIVTPRRFKKIKQIKSNFTQRTMVSPKVTKNYDEILQRYKNDPSNVTFKMIQLKKTMKENFAIIFPNYSEVFSARQAVTNRFASPKATRAPQPVSEPPIMLPPVEEPPRKFKTLMNEDVDKQNWVRVGFYQRFRSRR